MNHYFVCPAVHVENTVGFLDSLDPDIARERVILLDNTRDMEIAKACKRRVARVTAYGRNAGVATAWNDGAQMAFELGATFVTLTSTSMRLRPDGGAALCRTADLAAENGQWPFGFESMNGWHLITLGKALFETVGFFDEQFHPAYFEDNDMIWRLRCAGILEPAGGDRSLRQIPWIGALQYRCVQDGHAIAHAGIKVDLEVNLAKYLKKWGGPPGEETIGTGVTRPFPAYRGDMEYPPPGDAA